MGMGQELLDGGRKWPVESEKKKRGVVGGGECG